MAQMQPEERKKLEEKLIKRIWDNPEFAEEITREPSKVLQEEFGVIVPQQTKVYIHQEKVNEIHIVIPKY